MVSKQILKSTLNFTASRGKGKPQWYTANGDDNEGAKSCTLVGACNHRGASYSTIKNKKLHSSRRSDHILKLLVSKGMEGY